MIILAKIGKGKFTIEQVIKAQRWSRSIPVHSCFNLSARWGWVVNALPWPLYHWERDPLPIVLISYTGQPHEEKRLFLMYFWMLNSYMRESEMKTLNIFYFIIY